MSQYTQHTGQCSYWKRNECDCGGVGAQAEGLADEKLLDDYIGMVASDVQVDSDNLADLIDAHRVELLRRLRSHSVPRCPKCSHPRLLIKHDCQDGDWSVVCESVYCSWSKSISGDINELHELFGSGQEG